jgi:polar amino acid transport system substrate-binding protein
MFASCEKEEFVIGITYFEPMNYFDEDGKLTGFETEFAEAVCKKLGLTPKFVEIEWNTKEIELNAGNIDCIWNGMTINAERQETMGISSPYMENKQVLVTKAENVGKYSTPDGLAGAKVCAEAGSAGEEVILTDDLFADSTYVEVGSMAMALLEVASGTSDACVIDFVTSIGMIGEDTDYAGLSVVEAYEFGLEYYGIAFRKTDTETLDKFNKAIAELMEDGTIAAIAAKYKLDGQLVK